MLSYAIGTPWAIQAELVEQVRRVFGAHPSRFSALRELAALHPMVAGGHAQHAAPSLESLALWVDAEHGLPVAQGDVAAARGRGAKAGEMVVAVIPVLGMLTQRKEMGVSTASTSTDGVAALVRAQASDQRVNAVVLEFDSPGGSVLGGTEAAAAIREARAVKPVVAVANSVAASLAYWLAAQADELFVTPSGVVGSIGVYAVHEDMSAAAEQEGVRYTYVSAGKYKVEGHPHGPLSEEAVTAMQAEVDRYYGMFVGDVAKGRKVPGADVRSGFGEGRMVGAKAAVEAKMADRVGTLSEAVQRAAALARQRGREDAGRAERAAAASLEAL